MRTANHLLTLVVVCAVLGFPLQSFAAKTVTVTMAGCALEAALKIVAAAAEVPITAEAGVRDCKVTLDVVNQPVAAVLDQICEQAGCDWEKHDGKYLLVAKGAGNGTAVVQPAGAGVAPDEAPNLIANPGFENGLAGWGPVAPPDSKGPVLCEDIVAEGKQAVRLDGPVGMSALGVGTSPWMDLTSARRYHFTMQYRTSGDNAHLYLRLMPGDPQTNDHPRASLVAVAGPSPGKWSKYECDFWVCEAARQARLDVLLMDSSGSAWIDDLRLAPVAGSELGAKATQDPVDLVSNGQFEEGVGGMPFGWFTYDKDYRATDAGQTSFGKQVSFKWDDQQAHAGKRSLLISNSAPPADGPYLSWTRSLGVWSNVSYQASVWVRTENADYVEMSLRAEGDTGKAGYMTTRQLNGTQDWTRLWVTLPPIATDAKHCVLKVFLLLKGSGKVWFDDFEIHAVRQ